MINSHYQLHTQLVGNEDNKIVIIDDVLADPDTLVRYACNQQFHPYASAAARKGYPGVRAQTPPELGNAIRQTIIPVIRQQFSQPTHSEVKTYQEAFCLMSTPPHALGPLQTIPHFDASSTGFFAILLYLCDHNHGGTALYRHNATGIESVTPNRCDLFLDTVYQELNSKRREKTYIGDSDPLFTRIAYFPATYNRMMIYPGSLLHSANINSDSSLTHCPSTGRLTCNFFIEFC